MLQALVNHTVQRMKDTPTTTPTVAIGNPPPPLNPPQSPPSASPPTHTAAKETKPHSGHLSKNILSQEKPRRAIPRECRRGSACETREAQRRERDLLARRPSDKENVVGRLQAKSSGREGASRHRAATGVREGRGRRGSGGGEGLRLGKRGWSHSAAKMEEEEKKRGRGGGGVKRVKRSGTEASKGMQKMKPSQVHLPRQPDSHKIESPPRLDHATIVSKPSPPPSPPPTSSTFTDESREPAYSSLSGFMTDTRDRKPPPSPPPSSTATDCDQKRGPAAPSLPGLREPPPLSDPSLVAPSDVVRETLEELDVKTCSIGTIPPSSVRIEKQVELDSQTCFAGTTPGFVSAKPALPEQSNPQRSEEGENAQQDGTGRELRGRECGMTQDEGEQGGVERPVMKECDDSSSLEDTASCGGGESQEMVLMTTVSLEEDTVTLFPERDLQPGIELSLTEEAWGEEGREDGELSSDESRPPTPSSSPYKAAIFGGQRERRGRAPVDCGKGRAGEVRLRLRDLEKLHDFDRQRTRGRDRGRVREIDHRARYPRKPPSPPRPRELRPQGFLLPPLPPPHRRIHRHSRRC